MARHVDAEGDFLTGAPTPRGVGLIMEETGFAARESDVFLIFVTSCKSTTYKMSFLRANGGNGEGNDEFLISVISVFSCSIAYITISTELVNIAISAPRPRPFVCILSIFEENRHKCLCMKYLRMKLAFPNQA
jgi:hypothetical protein